jgi:hypothetical protein
VYQKEMEETKNPAAPHPPSTNIGHGQHMCAEWGKLLRPSFPLDENGLGKMFYAKTQSKCHAIKTNNKNNLQ